MGKVETGSARRGASRAAGRSTLWRSLADDFALRRDGTEARMAVLQQVMLAVVVLVITAFAIIAAIPGDLTLFFVGVAMVFVMTIVTMLQSSASLHFMTHPSQQIPSMFTSQPILGNTL